jgi:hypothetical protein
MPYASSNSRKTVLCNPFLNNVTVNTYNSRCFPWGLCRVLMREANLDATPSRQLSGLQTREGGGAEEEIAENTQNYNGEGVLLQPYHGRCLLRGGAPRQYSATTTTAGAPSSCARSIYRSKIPYPGFWTTTKRRTVSQGSNCKQPTSRQHVESGNCRTFLVLISVRG